MIQAMVRKFPKNPYVLSKAGKFYLEIGNRAEANIYFGKVRAML
jgi:predicted Zn-dependent protease